MAIDANVKSKLRIEYIPEQMKYVLLLKDGNKEEGFVFHEGNSAMFIACGLEDLANHWTKEQDTRIKTKEKLRNLQDKYDELYADHMELLGVKEPVKPEAKLKPQAIHNYDDYVEAQLQAYQAKILGQG